MIRTRLLASAFLICGDRLLLMRRASNRKLFPGRWAPIGGHLEAYEINDPRITCIREIREETGLAENQVIDLSLKYLVLRRRDNEIRTQYMYFGSTSHEDVGKTEEGELCWVQLDTAMDLNVSATTRFALKHYLRLGVRTVCVYVGTMDARDGRPVIDWAVLRDWE